MNRKSFVRRLLGLAATAVVAPEAVHAIIKEVEKAPEPKPWVDYKDYKGRGLSQLTGKRETPRAHQVLHRSGKNFYVLSAVGDNIEICDIYTRCDKKVITVEEFLNEYRIMCSAVPEVSNI
jgi:hypothetical protein